MQTIKTAAIVVLTLSLLFGAYNSMTTPPDPLPAEIAPMLVESGEFDLSDGLPGSFDDLGIDDGQVAALDPLPTQSAADPSDPGALVSPEIGFAPPRTGDDVSLETTNRTFADLPPAPDSTAPASFQLSDQDGGIRRLPPIGQDSPAFDIDSADSYPSTGDNYTPPDPGGVAGVTDSSQPGAVAIASGNDVASAGLANAIATADRQYSADRRREALATLSLFYETPNLTSDQREQLLIRLDPLASEVVYSQEHLLDKPHRVGPNETLMEIAKQYDVPWQLLANINGISDPVTVLPGRDLKVVRGPFRADVDLANRELTLFVGDLYAGRFPVAVGSDPSPKPGTYTIQEKQSAKTYYDMSGTPIPPGNPRNPYGSMWIDLGSGLSLHGSPEADRPSTEGCISVAGNYARDVFGILSEGSSVTIR
ncbi:MAG: L,D-transpeptidase family protein [Planctomycetota bacterium]